MNYCPRCCCSCFSDKDVPKQYPHVDYHKLSTPHRTKFVAEMPEFHQVPMKKIFQLPQMEYCANPDFRIDEVITQQPVLQQTAGQVQQRRMSQSMEDFSSVGQFKPSLLGMDYECRINFSSSSDIDRKRGSWVPDNLEMETSAELDKETKEEPRLTFSLYYDIQRCTLTLTLFKAYDLPANEQRGTNNAFVVMYLDPSMEELFQTRIVYRTMNPSFNEQFEFKKIRPDDIRHQTMVFKVYDHDKYSKKDFIGASMLPLKDADLYGITMNIPIDDKALEARSGKGELLISLSYQPPACQLQGVVLKATGLQKRGRVRLADPYVKIYLVRDGKRITKWKTSVKKNTLIPAFNESFVFDVAMMNPSGISLEVLVMDYDRFSANDLVGVIIIGENSPHESGKSHWEEIMASPKHRVCRWHSIRPPQPGFQVGTLKRS